MKNRPHRKLTKLQKAYFRRAAELDASMADPQGTMDRLSDATRNLRTLDHNIGNAVAEEHFNRLMLIHKKLPKGPPMGYLGSEYDEYIPSDHAIAKFARYAGAAWNPMSVLDSMNRGRLTKEEAEALRDTSPEIYMRIQERFIEELPKTEGRLPFNKIVQLSILFDMPADSVMSPEAMRERQKVFMAAQEEKKANLSNVKQTAENQITQSQRLQK